MMVMMFYALAGCVLLSNVLSGLILAYLAVALFRSTRGEKADGPEEPDPDDLVHIAEAIADNTDSEHWHLWEAEFAEGADR